ncbi:pantoate--beta-alanine ligase [Spartobacteria bacterium LR76]|nr:pantoate--beta-alanine ligase [Spartobacteria bacterium LR76]
MKIAQTVAVARRSLRAARSAPVVLVPTMGALHHGHAALIRQARRLAGRKGTVVVSIFVNPIQFGPREDFASYPRPFARDVKVCRESGADLVFAPTPEEMYAGDRSVIVDEGSLSAHLCGASRPGHFRGVCTVVAKLFLIVQPDIAIFGEKDYQQLAILRRMVRDLNFPIEIVGHPTMREADGLATSSRNAYLTPEERTVAPGIQAALQEASLRKTPAAILNTGLKLISRIPGARIDYLKLVDAETLEDAKSLRRPARLAAAVYLGKARLIDNIAVLPRP